MTRIPAILTSILLMMLASGCKREQAPEAPSAESHAAETEAASDDEPEKAAEPAKEKDQAAPKDPADSVEAAAETQPTLPVPGGWTRISAATPKGEVVSFGVPEGWVEVNPPNKDTLALWGAPVNQPGGTEGTKASLVAVEFKGGLQELADDTRLKLAGFAEILSEGPLRVGKIKAHRTVARWSTPVGQRDTVQILVATGEEAIGLTCELMPGKIETLSPLCDEIFATLTIGGSSPHKRTKR